uniref:Brefeldin A-inhibited guanine nucleotide-exchange protein 2 n=1 Tax=Lygus hesperus TaxID=30085 RepID=A0A0A9W103_LYGHE
MHAGQAPRQRLASSLYELTDSSKMTLSITLPPVVENRETGAAEKHGSGGMKQIANMLFSSFCAPPAAFASNNSDEIMASCEELCTVYFDFYLDQHLNLVQHTLFDLLYTYMVAVPAMMRLEFA